MVCRQDRNTHVIPGQNINSHMCRQNVHATTAWGQDRKIHAASRQHRNSHIHRQHMSTATAWRLDRNRSRKRGQRTQTLSPTKHVQLWVSLRFPIHFHGSQCSHQWRALQSVLPACNTQGHQMTGSNQVNLKCSLYTMSLTACFRLLLHHHIILPMCHLLHNK